MLKLGQINLCNPFTGNSPNKRNVRLKTAMVEKLSIKNSRNQRIHTSCEARNNKQAILLEKHPNWFDSVASYHENRTEQLLKQQERKLLGALTITEKRLQNPYGLNLESEVESVKSV